MDVSLTRFLLCFPQPRELFPNHITYTSSTGRDIRYSGKIECFSGSTSLGYLKGQVNGFGEYGAFTPSASEGVTVDILHDGTTTLNMVAKVS